MARNIELLLLETVENLGIVGDMVKVRPGFARNYLLPHGVAEFPTPEKIESLKEVRAKALAEVAAARNSREELLGRMNEVSVTLTRSCNDQGVLYGSISQRDVADALHAAGYGVDIRAVRLSQSIRRVGTYHVPIQLEKDLRTEITLTVAPDRQLEAQIREDEAKAAAARTADAGESDAEGDDKGASPEAGDRKGPGGRRDGKPGGRSDERRGDKPAERGAGKGGDSAPKGGKESPKASREAEPKGGAGGKGKGTKK